VCFCWKLKNSADYLFYSLFQPISDVFGGGSIILIVMQEFPLPFWKKNKKGQKKSLVNQTGWGNPNKNTSFCKNKANCTTFSPIEGVHTWHHRQPKWVTNWWAKRLTGNIGFGVNAANTHKTHLEQERALLLTVQIDLTRNLMYFSQTVKSYRKEKQWFAAIQRNIPGVKIWHIKMSGNTISGCMSKSMDHWIFGKL